MQRIALCRSQRELSNAYFVAKFGLDTAENEPCQVCPTEPFPKSLPYGHMRLTRARLFARLGGKALELRYALLISDFQISVPSMIFAYYHIWIFVVGQHPLCRLGINSTSPDRSRHRRMREGENLRELLRYGAAPRSLHRFCR